MSELSFMQPDKSSSHMQSKTACIYYIRQTTEYSNALNLHVIEYEECLGWCGLPGSKYLFAYLRVQVILAVVVQLTPSSSSYFL